MQSSLFERYRLSNVGSEQAERHIRHACIVGVLSVAATAVYASLVNGLMWADATVLALLVLGLYKRNVPSAVLLVVYFAVTQAVFWASGRGNALQAFVALAFLHFYYLGALGVLRYRKTRKEGSTVGNVVFGGVCGVLLAAFVVMLAFGPSVPTLGDNAWSAEETTRRRVYQGGYEAGYADGRSEDREFGESSAPPPEPERREFYYFGYLEGFVEACEERGINCARIERALRDVYEKIEAERDVREDDSVNRSG